MATIITTHDGSHSLLSDEFGVSYHSKYGAIQETKHVFIDAALQPIALKNKEIAVLEIGFGTGLNAYMTLLEAERLSLPVQYTTYEAFPVPMHQVEQLNYSEALAADQSLFEQLHNCQWNVPHQICEHFLFVKYQKKFQEIATVNAFDVIYFDAFAPNAQPELWEAPLMQAMYDALKIGGVLTTYCAKGVVKRTMKSVGFEIEAIPGPPGKREMTRAWKRPT